MKWLQWSRTDLTTGLGGVEVHSQSIARELRQLGVQVEFSHDPRAIFQNEWDVIHTHGSSLLSLARLRGKLRGRGSPVWVHTLHGLTHERMIACREFFWPGGYKAISRELTGLLCADVVLAIHPDLSFFPLIRKAKRNVVVCSNGWDSWGADANTKVDTSLRRKIDKLAAFWLFIGRGDDYVKGTDILLSAVKKDPDSLLVAVPGIGFEGSKNVLQTGSLNAREVRWLLTRARGLVSTSRYEGLPLVVLEALAQGVPVVCTNVGGNKTLSPSLEGLIMTEPTPKKIGEAIKRASAIPYDDISKEQRALNNRSHLQTWKDVAQVAYSEVQKVRTERGLV